MVSRQPSSLERTPGQWGMGVGPFKDSLLDIAPLFSQSADFAEQHTYFRSKRATELVEVLRWRVTLAISGRD